MTWQPHWLTVHCGPLMPWRSTMPNATLEAPLASVPWTKCFNQFHAPRIILQDSSHCGATLPNLSPSLEKDSCYSHACSMSLQQKLLSYPCFFENKASEHGKKRVCPWCKSTYINFKSSFSTKNTNFHHAAE